MLTAQKVKVNLYKCSEIKHSKAAVPEQVGGQVCGPLHFHLQPSGAAIGGIGTPAPLSCCYWRGPERKGAEPGSAVVAG